MPYVQVYFVGLIVVPTCDPLDINDATMTFYVNDVSWRSNVDDYYVNGMDERLGSFQNPYPNNSDVALDGPYLKAQQPEVQVEISVTVNTSDVIRITGLATNTFQPPRYKGYQNKPILSSIQDSPLGNAPTGGITVTQMFVQPNYLRETAPGSGIFYYAVDGGQINLISGMPVPLFSDWTQGTSPTDDIPITTGIESKFLVSVQLMTSIFAGAPVTWPQGKYALEIDIDCVINPV